MAVIIVAKVEKAKKMMTIKKKRKIIKTKENQIVV